MPIGTFINIAAVILGSTVGILLNKYYPEKIKAIVFQGIGLSSLLIGMQMALKVENLLVIIFSMILGGIVGESINLDGLFDRFGNFLKGKIGSKNSDFTYGLITAFLLYCMGSLTILGALNEGIKGDRTLLLTKSLLDGFTSIALASTYGIGVMFSVIPMLLYQGGLTLFASQSQTLFTPVLMNQLSTVGGLLILGIALNILEIKKIKVTNFLPALIVVTILTFFFK